MLLGRHASPTLRPSRREFKFAQVLKEALDWGHELRESVREVGPHELRVGAGGRCGPDHIAVHPQAPGLIRKKK